MIPQRTFKSKRAKAVFFRTINDIDVFVEDTTEGTEKLYSIIISKALKNNYKINKVFQLGGKLEVAKAWQSRNLSTGRSEIYLLDADFSLYGIENNKYPYNLNGDSLVILNRFCIENYLFSENALIDFMHDEDLQKNVEEIKNEFEFDNWIANISAGLKKLFIYMATTRAIDETISVKRWRYSDIISSNDGLIDVAKVNRICNILLDSCLEKVTQSEFDEIKTKIESHFQNDSFDIKMHVCGKDYLFGLSTLRAKSITSIKVKNNLIKQKLASRVEEISISSELGEQIMLSLKLN